MAVKGDKVRLAVWVLAGALAIPAGLTPPAGAAEAYNPQIVPTDFTADITRNPYLRLPVGRKLVYESRAGAGVERTEILIPGWTRTIMGVETLVYWDRVYFNGELVEDTRDYLAQHKNGDVWYFGEDVDNYRNGQLTDHGGGWIAGVDGALPGIWLVGNPRVGDSYRQEYNPGRAEDAAKVVSVSETVSTPLGTFRDCLKTFDWSPLSRDTEHKYYCRETGSAVVEADVIDGTSREGSRTVIVEVVEDGALAIALPEAFAREGVVDASAGK